MLVLILVELTISAIAFYYLQKWLWNWYILTKLPGPPRGSLFSGNLATIRAPPEIMFKNFRQLSEQFYPIYRICTMHKVGVSIISPEDCELILSNPIHHEKGEIYNVFHNWLKTGLLTSRGSKWQNRRKILTPAFHFNILQQFVQVFNEEAIKLVDGFKEESCKNPEVKITSHIAQFTLKTIIETALGMKLNLDTEEGKEYHKAVLDEGRIIVYRIVHPWCIRDVGNFFLSPHFDKEIEMCKLLHKFTRSLIQSREVDFKETDLETDEHDVYKGKKRLAMLDLLLSSKHKDNLIDDRGIQEEVDTFTYEAHDTTALALQFIFLLLANHRNVQNLIYQEMCEVLEDLHKKPTYTDLQNFKYMERVIKECLRLYPSVPLISRTLGQSLTTTSGYYLPKETSVIIHIYDIHHDPKFFPNPETFDPDRFLPENSTNRHPFAYLPFSAGPRNCIGQKFAMLELKATICAVLANFILEPVDTPESIVLITDIVLRTKDEIKVRFIPRIDNK